MLSPMVRLSSSVLLMASVVPSLAFAQTPQVWSHWSDGKAEVNGYELLQPRYGEERRGTAVLIFVTEPFSESARVKADPGMHPAADVFPALKLNVIKSFQTGVYDYHLMTSVFAAMEARSGARPGALTKLAFSSQEWCGVLFEELLFDPGRIRQARFSYFDGEGDEARTLDLPRGGILVDELPLVARSLPVPLLAPGESKSLELLPSVERQRLLHRPLAWRRGTLSRGAKPSPLEVPAGRFEAETWTAELGPGERYELWIEAAFPHRLLMWRGPDGESGRLGGSARIEYWKMQREGMERALEQLGLPVPLAPRVPR